MNNTELALIVLACVAVSSLGLFVWLCRPSAEVRKRAGKPD